MRKARPNLENHLNQDDRTSAALWAFYEALKSQFNINLPDHRDLADVLVQRSPDPVRSAGDFSTIKRPEPKMLWVTLCTLHIRRMPLSFGEPAWTDSSLIPVSSSSLLEKHLLGIMHHDGSR